MNNCNSLHFESYRKKIVNVIQKLGTNDFYTFIGIDRQATKDEINKAYSEKALKLYFDRNANDKRCIEVSKILIEVSEILLDDNIRSYYNNNYLPQKSIKIETQNIIGLVSSKDEKKLFLDRDDFQYPRENNISPCPQTLTLGHSTTNNQVLSRLKTESVSQRHKIKALDFTKHEVLIRFSDFSQQTWFSELGLEKQQVLHNYILNSTENDSVEHLLLELMRLNPSFNYAPKLLKWSDEFNKWLFLEKQEFWLSYFEKAERYKNLINAILEWHKKGCSMVIFENLLTALLYHKASNMRSETNFTKKLQFCNNVFTFLTKRLSHNDQVEFFILSDRALDKSVYHINTTLVSQFERLKQNESQELKQLVMWAKTKRFTVESCGFALRMLCFWLKTNIISQVPSDFSADQKEKLIINQLSSLNESNNLQINADCEKENVEKTKITNKLSINFILDQKENLFINRFSVVNRINVLKRKHEEIDEEANIPPKKLKFFSITSDETATKIAHNHHDELQFEKKHSAYKL